MNTPISSKLILRQIIRSCFSLCVSIGFVLNPFLAIAELEHSSYSMNLSNKETFSIKLAYKTILHKANPKGEEVYKLANKIYSNHEKINIKTSQKYLRAELKNKRG